MKSELSEETRQEIAEIFAKIRQYDEAKEVGIKLISKLKSEAEGRGVVPLDVLARLRKAFDFLTAPD